MQSIDVDEIHLKESCINAASFVRSSKLKLDYANLQLAQTAAEATSRPAPILIAEPQTVLTIIGDGSWQTGKSVHERDVSETAGIENYYKMPAR